MFLLLQKKISHYSQCVSNIGRVFVCNLCVCTSFVCVAKWPVRTNSFAHTRVVSIMPWQCAVGMRLCCYVCARVYASLELRVTQWLYSGSRSAHGVRLCVDLLCGRWICRCVVGLPCVMYAQGFARCMHVCHRRRSMLAKLRVAHVLPHMLYARKVNNEICVRNKVMHGNLDCNWFLCAEEWFMSTCQCV